MIIYVLRHGVTQWNRTRRLQGMTDIPLAEEGILLAKKTGEALKDVRFDICFTSPLTRAKETARHVLGDRDIPIIADERIREISFGVLEGTQFKDDEGCVISKELDLFFNHPADYECPKDGESFSDILKRTRDFWLEKTSDPALENKTILVSSHGCAVRALLQNIYKDSLENYWHGCVPPNCSVNIVEVKHGQAVFLAEDKVYG